MHISPKAVTWAQASVREAVTMQTIRIPRAQSRCARRITHFRVVESYPADLWQGLDSG